MSVARLDGISKVNRAFKKLNKYGTDGMKKEIRTFALSFFELVRKNFDRGGAGSRKWKKLSDYTIQQRNNENGYYGKVGGSGIKP